jgi:hypothetical protein
MTQAITIEYLRDALRVCWPAARLAAAAQEWPANPTWAWWLGERLAAMPRADKLERVSVAIAHVRFQRMQAPASARDLWLWAREASEAQLQAGGAALGAWLDTGSRDAARQLLATMRGELGAALAGVIEAAPPPPADDAPSSSAQPPADAWNSPPPDSPPGDTATAASSTTTTTTAKKSKRP